MAAFRPRKGERVVYKELDGRKWRAAVVLVVHNNADGIRLRYTLDGKRHLEAEVNIHLVRKPSDEEAAALKNHWDYLADVGRNSEVEELGETHVPLYVQMQNLGFKAWRSSPSCWRGCGRCLRATSGDLRIKM